MLETGLEDFWEMSGTCLGYFLQMSGTFLANVWDMLWTCLGRSWDLSGTILRQILGISHIPGLSGNSGMVNNKIYKKVKILECLECDNSGIVRNVTILKQLKMSKSRNGPECEKSGIVLNVKILEWSTCGNSLSVQNVKTLEWSIT